MKDGESYVVVGTGDKAVEIELSDVQNVVEVPSITDKWVTATVTDADGKEQEIAGIAEYVVVQKEQTYVYVDGHYVPFDNIKTIKENK